MTDSEVTNLLEQFRASRHELMRRLSAVPVELRAMPPAPGSWSACDLLTHIAAWIDEANDRIPRLMAGATSTPYAVDAFNAAAVARAVEWTPDQTLGAFRRAADRFETIVAETDPADLLDSDDVMLWLRSIAGTVMNEHFADFDRLSVSLTLEGQDHPTRDD